MLARRKNKGVKEVARVQSPKKAPSYQSYLSERELGVSAEAYAVSAAGGRITGYSAQGVTKSGGWGVGGVVR